MRKLKYLFASLAALLVLTFGAAAAQATPLSYDDYQMFNQTDAAYCHFPGASYCAMFDHSSVSHHNGYAFDGSSHHWGQTYYTQSNGFVWRLDFTDTGYGVPVGTWAPYARDMGPGPHTPYCSTFVCFNPVTGW